MTRMGQLRGVVTRSRRLIFVALLVPALIAGTLAWTGSTRSDARRAIPVAIVNLDHIVTDPTPMAAGRELTAALTDPGSDAGSALKWSITDANDASSGLRDGRYYSVLTIPANFSENVVSLGSDDPRPTELALTSNNASSASVGIVSQAVAEAATRALGDQVSSAYLNKIYLGLNDVANSFGSAADSAKDLSGGATQLAHGTGEVAGATRQLALGLQPLDAGAHQLSAGSRHVAEGAGRIVRGIGHVAGGTHQLSSGLAQLSNGAVELRGDAADLADGAAKASAAAGQLGNGAAATAQGASQLAAALGNLSGGCSAAGGAAAYCGQLAAAAMQSRTLATGATGVADGATSLANATARIADGSRALETGADHLSAGSHQAATSASRLARSEHRLTTGARDVADAAKQLASGADSLASGASASASGAGALASSTSRVTDAAGRTAGGADQLAKALTSGAEQAPTYSEKDRDQLTDVVTNPVRLRAADTPGTHRAGWFASLLLALVLWLGAVAGSFAGGRSDRRVLLAPASSRALARRVIRPSIAAAVLQSFVAVAVVVAFGLDVARVPELIGLGMLGAVVVTVVCEAVRAFSGRATTSVMLVLLVLQLAALGNLVPIETAPEPLQHLGRLLPLDLLVSAGTKIAAGGVGPVHVGDEVLLLLAWVAAGMAGLVVALRRQRRRVAQTQVDLMVARQASAVTT